MLAIIFDHTEICFTGDNIVPYRMYVPDVLMAFFFLSGYLFYRPEGFRLRHKLHSYGAQNEAYKCLLAENVANDLCLS